MTTTRAKPKARTAGKRKAPAKPKAPKTAALDPVEAPAPPKGLSAESCAWWYSYFASHNSTPTPTLLKGLGRLAQLYDLYAAALRDVQERGFEAPGYKGNRVQSASARQLTTLGAEISKLEHRYYLTPRGEALLARRKTPEKPRTLDDLFSHEPLKPITRGQFEAQTKRDYAKWYREHPGAGKFPTPAAVSPLVWPDDGDED